MNDLGALPYCVAQRYTSDTSGHWSIAIVCHVASEPFDLLVLISEKDV